MIDYLLISCLISTLIVILGFPIYEVAKRTYDFSEQQKEFLIQVLMWPVTIFIMGIAMVLMLIKFLSIK